MLLAILCWAVPFRVQGENPALTYEKDVRPILKEHCFHCHGEENIFKGGLDTRLNRFLLKGGEKGPEIIPGDPDKSRLYVYVRDGKMPKGESKLESHEIGIIRDWIKAGAKNIRAEPETIGHGYMTEEERSHWAFLPVARPSIPRIDGGITPVDSFIRERFLKEGLDFSAEADKVSLIRRVYLDLVGLPPETGDVEAFLSDKSPDAYEQLVERLLTSPHYGERWGRHWLDAAGYSDSEGYNEDDVLRTDSFRYRDYVVQAFNDDMPIDQFLREQLAGDEMVQFPYEDLKDDEIRQLTATGFLRMVDDGTGGRNPDQNLARHEVMRATVSQVSATILGLTVSCAECHDHRFDPILQDDYYRLRAIFEPALDWTHWRTPVQRRISLLTTEERRQADLIEQQAKLIDDEIYPKFKEFQKFVFEEELKDVPDDIREKAKVAGLAFQKVSDEATRTKKPREMLSPEQEKLLAEYPSLKVDANEQRLNLFLNKYGKDKELKEFLEDVKKRAGEVRKQKPQENFLRALSETPGPIPATYVYLRGNRTQRGKVVEAGGLTVLGGYDILSNAPNLPSTGRRLAYANYLTNRSHPLTARVFVNRVWMHHFEKGLVATPGDFGIRGSRPTHPKLLDWLAASFMENGWKLKDLHRLIVNSRTYRQTSARGSGGEKVDSENEFYWRMPIRRLEAEAVRDSILAVSGNLNRRAFGAPVVVTPDQNQQMIVGTEKPTADGSEFRRSLYVQRRRTAPAYVLQVFDEPEMTPVCERRDSSTVATQSLLLMNSDFVLQQADEFARRVLAEAGKDVRSRVTHAWRLAYQCNPSEIDIKEMAEYVTAQQELLKDKIKPPPPVKPAAKMDADKGAEVQEPMRVLPPPTPESKALASLCQVLLASNRLLYVH